MDCLGITSIHKFTYDYLFLNVNYFQYFIYFFVLLNLVNKQFQTTLF